MQQAKSKCEGLDIFIYFFDSDYYNLDLLDFLKHKVLVNNFFLFV